MTMQLSGMTHSICFGFMAMAIAVTGAPAPQDTASVVVSNIMKALDSASVTAAAEEPWKTAQCTTPEITDATENPADRWTSVDADAAWKAAVEYATTTENTGGLSFPALISNFFHGPDQMNCGLLNSRGACDTTSKCEAPASGFLILNSLVAISSFNWNLFDAIDKAQGQVTTQMGTYSSVFAPMSDNQQHWKILLDILGVLFALAMAPAWNSFFRTIPYFNANPNKLGTIKDAFMPAVASAIIIAKDAGLSNPKLDAQNDLTTNVGNLIDSWSNTINIYNKQLFDGSEASIDLLYSQIKDGQVLEATYSLDQYDVQAGIEKALYAGLLPQAWAASNQDLNPVIIDAGAPCGTKDPVDKKYIAPKAGEATWACADGNMYYLLMASLETWECKGQGGAGYSCQFETFKMLPGVATMDGTAWGGLTREDIIVGAVNTFKANGNANGAAAIDVSTTGAVEDIADNGVRAVGVFNIPVCGAEEAYENWKNKKDDLENYPCN